MLEQGLPVQLLCGCGSRPRQTQHPVPGRARQIGEMVGKDAQQEQRQVAQPPVHTGALGSPDDLQSFGHRGGVERDRRRRQPLAVRVQVTPLDTRV